MAKVPPMRRGHEGWKRRERPGHVLDVDEICLHPSDALEVQLDPLHRQLG